MVRVTVCPHLLVELPQNISVAHIERDYIAPLMSCIREARLKKIDICLSKELVSLYECSFPWTKMSDPKWKGYLLDWDTSIRSNLINHAKISEVPAISSGNIICTLLSDQVNGIFEALLLKLGSGGMPLGMHPEGIISNKNCCNNKVLSCFQFVKSKKDLEKISFPWLRIYNRPLPTGGAYPFVPPKNWTLRASPIRDSKFSNNGYVDFVGHEWEWDKLHDDHWDVQHSAKKQDYTNVNVDGSIR